MRAKRLHGPRMRFMRGYAVKLILGESLTRFATDLIKSGFSLFLSRVSLCCLSLAFLSPPMPPFFPKLQNPKLAIATANSQLRSMAIVNLIAT